MREIPLFEPRKNRTLLSASAANELVIALNAFIRMRGGTGIKITKSDAGFVIDATGATSGTTPPPINETGTLIWGGRWEDKAYSKDTLVIVDEVADILDGTLGGQYVSLQDIPIGTPKPGLDGSENFWELSARGNWGKLILTDEADTLKAIEMDSQGSIADPDGGMGLKPAIQLLENRETPDGGAWCLIRLSDLSGKKAKFREWDVCVGGVWRKALFLSTEDY